MTIYRKCLFSRNWRKVDHIVFGSVGLRYIITNRI